MDLTVQLNKEQNRILSIDFFRGLVMFILVSGIGTLFNGFIEQGKGDLFLGFDTAFLYVHCGCCYALFLS